MSFRSLLLPTIGAALLLATAARADYVLAPTSGGQAAISVAPGTSFTLDLELSSDDNDHTWASVFFVDFSKPGLQYTGYNWSAPYQTGGEDDASGPVQVSLPRTLDADAYIHTSNDLGRVDVYFANNLVEGQFTTGKLLSLNLQVPLGFAAGPVTISAVPIGFRSETLIPTTGASFTLDVTGPRIWSGSTDNVLATAANWVNGVPGANDPMVFGPGATRKDPTNGGPTPLAAVGGITFNETGYTLAGTDELAINGPIANNAPAATIDMPISLEAAGGIIDGGATATNVLTIAKPVGGSVGLTKRGAGKVVLSQNAAYTGDTIVEAGTLELLGIDNSDSTAVTGTLLAGFIRQDTLTIHAGGKVQTVGSGTSVLNFLQISDGTDFTWGGGGSLAPAGDSDAGSVAHAVPEPAAWLLLLSAIVAGYLYSRR